MGEAGVTVKRGSLQVGGHSAQWPNSCSLPLALTTSSESSSHGHSRPAVVDGSLVIEASRTAGLNRLAPTWQRPPEGAPLSLHAVANAYQRAATSVQYKASKRHSIIIVARSSLAVSVRGPTKHPVRAKVELARQWQRHTSPVREPFFLDIGRAGFFFSPGVPRLSRAARILLGEKIPAIYY